MANRNSRKNEGVPKRGSEFRDHRHSGSRKSIRTDYGRSTIPLVRPSISIDLERLPARYNPGDVLIGEYQIDVASEQVVSAVECSVIWLTSGKGDEDVGVHFFERRSKATLGSDQLRKPHRISTVLPQSPLSYAGELVQISWSVRLRIFIDEKQYLEDCQFQLGNVSLNEYQQLD